ncbi:DUF4347 domain-containing protein, partial [Pseudomonas sp. CrR25]|nr:DUF4347 domain-containing protein [Pseudomonas sp. CrR25]
MLFDGAVAASTTEALASVEPGAASAEAEVTADTQTAPPAATADSRQEIVFIDGQIQDYQQLMAGLPAGSEIVVLDSASNGLQQIADYLAGRSGIDAIHLLSHGESGAFKAGNTWIDGNSLAAQSALLAQIGEALTNDGDILLYGCRTAEGAAGAALVQELAHLTQADVAASTNNTGALQLGGDWVLENRSGSIEAASLGTGLLPFDALLAAPSSENFDGVTLTGGYNLGNPGEARTLNGWTFVLLDAGGGIDVQGYVDFTNQNGDSSMANNAGDVVAFLNGFYLA